MDRRHGAGGGRRGGGGARPWGRRGSPPAPDCGRPTTKRRQKPGMQVVMEAAAAAAASSTRRQTIVQDTGFWYRSLLAADEALKKKWPLRTADWIKRAKEDPGKWIPQPQQEWAMEETRCKKAKSGRHTDPGRDFFCSSSMSNDAASFLPFHLIFPRLPVRQRFRLRCVCKLWNSMLREPYAIPTIAECEQQEEYWFVMSHPLPPQGRSWNFKGISSLDRTLFRFPLPSPSHSKLSTLLGGRHCSLLPQFEHRFHAGVAQPRLVSAGGLMCAFVHRPDAVENYFVVVFNCLTGSVRVLPPPLLNAHYLSAHPGCSNTAGCLMYMSVDGQDPSRYYVMLTHQEAVVRDVDRPYFEIFDSRRGSWMVAGNIGSAVAMAVADDSKLPLGDFFFHAPEGTLLAYHATDDLWSKVLVPIREPGDQIGYSPTFSKYKGKILQARSLMAPDYRCLGFAVWELQLVSSKPAIWVEVARTPQRLSAGLDGLDWVPTIMGEGGLFCMVFEHLHLQGRFRPPLVYDVTLNLWYVLPGSTNFGCILVHRPRLSMRLSCLEGGEEAQ